MAKRPTITNVIGAGQLDTTYNLDLQFIASKIQGSRLNLKKFAGIVIRKSKPKGTVLLFRSKKFIIVGAENQQSCHLLSRRVAKDMQKVLSLPELKLKTFKISNMIANAHLGYKVNLARIAELPNAFKDDKSSAVFMKMGKVKSAVIFQSGKLLLNGTNKAIFIQEIYDQLCSTLQQFTLKKFVQSEQKQNEEEKRKPKARNKRGRKKLKRTENEQQSYNKNSEQQETPNSIQSYDPETMNTRQQQLYQNRIKNNIKMRKNSKNQQNY